MHIKWLEIYTGMNSSYTCDDKDDGGPHEKGPCRTLAKSGTIMAPTTEGGLTCILGREKVKSFSRPCE